MLRDSVLLYPLQPSQLVAASRCVLTGCKHPLAIRSANLRFSIFLQKHLSLHPQNPIKPMKNSIKAHYSNYKQS